MPLNHSLWDALWQRAAREEIGIVMRFTDGQQAHQHLRANKPAGFEDYTLARTGIDDTLIILRPGVTLNDESDAHAARQIFSDLE